MTTLSNSPGGTIRSEQLFVLLSGALLAAALLIGGSTRDGQLFNAAVRLLSLPVLLVSIHRIILAPPPRLVGLPLFLVLAVLAVPLIQLIPLPPGLWSHLPGRADYAETYQIARMAPPWLPLSLNPEGALNAFLALLPAVAMFLATLTLGAAARRALLALIVVVAIAALALGTAQMLGGDASPFRFYETTNRNAAVGFFANRNHAASLLVVAIPAAALWTVTAWSRWRNDRWLGLLLGATLFLGLAIGTAMSKSRGGLLLLPPAALACLVLVFRDRLFRMPRRVLLTGAAAAAVVVVALVVVLLPRFVAEAGEDVRARALPGIVAGGLAYSPLGSGLGTFEDIYRAEERPETVTNAFLNHAHNDYLELWLETGLVGPLLVLVFLYWFGKRAVALWRRPEGRNAQVGQAGSIMVALLVVHSLVDYPLRTAALSTVFGFACGLMFAIPGDLPAQERDHGAPRQLPRRRRAQLQGRR